MINISNAAFGVETCKTFYEIVSRSETKGDFVAFAHLALTREVWTELTMLVPPNGPIPEGLKCGFRVGCCVNLYILLSLKEK